MSYRSKFTQTEFNEHHKEFIENYSTKYRTMDLDFKMAMFMRGVSTEEFNRMINETIGDKRKIVSPDMNKKRGQRES